MFLLSLLYVGAPTMRYLHRLVCHEMEHMVTTFKLIMVSYKSDPGNKSCNIMPQA